MKQNDQKSLSQIVSNTTIIAAALRSYLRKYHILMFFNYPKTRSKEFALNDIAFLNTDLPLSLQQGGNVFLLLYNGNKR